MPRTSMSPTMVIVNFFMIAAAVASACSASASGAFMTNRKLQGLKEPVLPLTTARKPRQPRAVRQPALLPPVLPPRATAEPPTAKPRRTRTARPSVAAPAASDVPAAGTRPLPDQATTEE